MILVYFGPNFSFHQHNQKMCVTHILSICYYTFATKRNSYIVICHIYRPAIMHHDVSVNKKYHHMKYHAHAFNICVYSQTRRIHLVFRVSFSFIQHPTTCYSRYVASTHSWITVTAYKLHMSRSAINWWFNSQATTVTPILKYKKIHIQSLGYMRGIRMYKPSIEAGDGDRGGETGG